MILIENIDENVIYLFGVLTSVLVVVLAWLSTNVREFVFPGNLLVIERRSRRLYATSINGNLNRIINTHQLSPSLITTTSTTTAAAAANAQRSAASNNDPNESSTTTTTINLTAPANRNNQIDLVDEMVEQALVDNLLDGNYYTSDHQVGLINRMPETIRNNFNNRNQSSTQSSASDDVQSVETSANEPSSENESNSNTLTIGSNDLINILIKFVNEKEMRVQARPEDTILVLKRTHFATELNSNKIVRFIYQGQFLSDKNTIKSYNIKDQTTIHCHITSKQPTAAASPPNPSSDFSANNARQRINAHQITSITRITGESSIPQQQDLSPPPNANSSGITNPLSDNGNVTSISSAPSNQSSTNSMRVPLNRAARSRRLNHHHHMINTATIINVDLTNIFLPFFAVLLGSFWYIRVHFKHFFTPFSTLVLVLISFIYALFLFNNIYASSFVDANNQLTSRLFQRHRPHQHQQAQAVEAN